MFSATENALLTYQTVGSLFTSEQCLVVFPVSNLSGEGEGGGCRGVANYALFCTYMPSNLSKNAAFLHFYEKLNKIKKPLVSFALGQKLK